MEFQTDIKSKYRKINVNFHNFVNVDFQNFGKVVWKYCIPKDPGTQKALNKHY